MNAPGRPTMTTFLLARYGPRAIFSGGKFSRGRGDLQHNRDTVSSGDDVC